MSLILSLERKLPSVHVAWRLPFHDFWFYFPQLITPGALMMTSPWIAFMNIKLFNWSVMQYTAVAVIYPSSSRDYKHMIKGFVYVGSQRDGIVVWFIATSRNCSITILIGYTSAKKTEETAGNLSLSVWAGSYTTKHTWFSNSRAVYMWMFYILSRLYIFPLMGWRISLEMGVAGTRQSGTGVLPRWNFWFGKFKMNSSY